MIFWRRKDRRKKVLIVDDDANIRGMLAMLFAEQDIRILEAARGDEAVKLAQEELPALIVLDINLPGMTGLDALTLLRAGEKTRDIPIIMCTAHDTLDAVERCLQAGANDYIQKPFDLQHVLAKVRPFLGGRQQQEES
ncbi:MAG: response regulator [Elusimicrobiota bacterium]